MIRNMLEAVGHPQQATPSKTDNSTAVSFVNNALKQKRSKAWDVRYYLLKDQTALDNFYIYR